MARRHERHATWVAAWMLTGCFYPEQAVPEPAVSATKASVECADTPAPLGAPFSEAAPVGFSDQELKAIASELGLPRERTEVDGNVVRVGDDVVLDAHWLVQGAYGHGAAEGRQKGYRYEGLITCDRERNIQLRWAEGADAPPYLVQKVFQQAAEAWSADGVVSIHVANTGDAISVHVVPTERWSNDTPCDPDVDACALTPADGHAGAAVYVRARLEDVTPPCTWASGGRDILHFVALHELGHALGLHHPGLAEGSGRHIDGTEDCEADGGSDPDCGRDPGYGTVMVTGVQASTDCTMDLGTSPTADDYASLRALYGDS